MNQRPYTLPFEVLGQISPILAWAEGAKVGRLPETWTARTDSLPFKERERAWLLGELPTYSYDNIEDLLEGARRDHRTPSRAVVSELGDGHLRLSPPPNYDLLSAFQLLQRHFFAWNGGELCVEAGKMEQLHELALRFPAGHIVRHGHARAVSEGVTSFAKALRLPELVTVLPSNSLGLRNVVRKGLSEGHLHLKGVTSAEELWADNLLRPIGVRSLKSKDRAERRLLTLNLFAGRLVALAIWISYAPASIRLPVWPQKLLDLLDRLYFARSVQEEQQVVEALGNLIKAAVYDRPQLLDQKDRDELAERGDRDVDSVDSLINVPVPLEMEFLLRWMAPTGHRLEQWRHRKSTIPGSLMEDQSRRYRFVHCLHLAAHWRLIQLTPSREPIGDLDDDRCRQAGPRNRKETAHVFSDARRYFLHEALFRYIVCRTHHWQQATQQGRTTGLQHFRQYFASPQRRFTGVSDLQMANIVFERLQDWRGLRVLEGRVSPPERAQEIVPWILAYARPETQETRRIRKFGLVVHFKKEDEAAEERRHLSQSEWPVPWLRWGKRRRMVRAEAMRLYRLLRQPTPIVPFIVGIDACNLELATPPEVFAPIFRFLREFPITLRGEAQRFAPFFRLEPAIRRLVGERRLGMTYHVGEDFRHLLSGLRAICEAVDFLAPNPGDRLGHGTALALDPETWLENCGYQAVLPKLEWLDTLVWVHHFLGPGDDVVGELGIEDEIQKLAWQIYSDSIGKHYDPLGLSRRERPRTGNQIEIELERQRLKLRGLLDWDWSPLTLWDAWSLRQLDPYSLELIKLPQGELELRRFAGHSEEERRWYAVQKRVLRQAKQQVGSRNAYLLLAMYWLSADVRQKGSESIVVDMMPKRAQWLELCHRVEAKMKRQIHRKELIIEVNPSANRIIGPMANYSQHHVFHLTLDKEKRLNRGVRVSINTDNPAVCNTTLAHEYYLLGEILIRDGVPEAEVVEWLEWLRENGEAYNFAKRMKVPEENDDMRQLLEWLQNVRPSVLEAQTREGKYQAFKHWQRDTVLKQNGFDDQAIERNAPALMRLLSLEMSLRTLRTQPSPAIPYEDQIRSLEAQLAELRDKIEKGPTGAQPTDG